MTKIIRSALFFLIIFSSALLVNYLFVSFIYPVDKQLNDAGIVFIQEFELEEAQKNVEEKQGLLENWWANVKQTDSLEVVSLENLSPYPLYNQRLSEINEILEKGLVRVLRKKTSGEYAASDLLGVAVVLSNDGWLATMPEFFTYGVDFMDQAGNLLPVEYFVDDASTGIRFVKVKSDNLSVLKFANNGLVNGQFLLSVNSEGGVYLGNLLDKHYNRTGDLWSSEVLSRRYLLDFSEQLLLASPVFNFEGELVAILTKDLDGTYEALPVEYLALHLSDIYKKEWVSYGLNLSYRDLAYAFVPVNGFNKGAYVLNNTALYKNSEKKEFVNLLAGDIILEIDGQELNKDSGLVELLHQYKLGTVLKMKLWRQGQELEYEFYLGR